MIDYYHGRNCIFPKVSFLLFYFVFFRLFVIDNKVWEQVAEIQAHGKVVADHFLSDAVYKKSVKEDNL